MPVLITVSTPGVRVKVLGTWEHLPVNLGTGPISLVKGACVGDTIEVTDGVKRYQESIQFGEPYEQRVIVPRL